MNKALEEHHTTKPAMEEVELLERDVQPGDKRAVSHRHDKQGNHVGDGENT